jgi:hypothetical protein
MKFCTCLPEKKMLIETLLRVLIGTLIFLWVICSFARLIQRARLARWWAALV